MKKEIGKAYRKLKASLRFCCRRDAITKAQARAIKAEAKALLKHEPSASVLYILEATEKSLLRN